MKHLHLKIDIILRKIHFALKDEPSFLMDRVIPESSRSSSINESVRSKNKYSKDKNLDIEKDDSKGINVAKNKIKDY